MQGGWEGVNNERRVDGFFVVFSLVKARWTGRRGGVWFALLPADARFYFSRVCLHPSICPRTAKRSWRCWQEVLVIDRRQPQDRSVTLQQ
jgi:hypothetical protein